MIGLPRNPIFIINISMTCYTQSNTTLPSFQLVDSKVYFNMPPAHKVLNAKINNIKNPIKFDKKRKT